MLLADGGCRSSAAAEERIFRNCILAGFRSAGSHCENSGSSDDTCASARSGSTKQRSLLCPLSERGCRHPLLFAVLDLLVLLDQDKSTRRKKMHDRRNRFFGKNSGAKIGYVVSAGRRPWDTPTVAGLRRRRLQPARRKGPQYFKPDCGVSQGRNLACTARCSVNSRKVRSSRRFPPVPLRSDRHDAPPDIPKGNRHTERSTRPSDKQREPFPMKRFPFSFPQRIPPDPA